YGQRRRVPDIGHADEMVPVRFPEYPVAQPAGGLEGIPVAPVLGVERIAYFRLAGRCIDSESGAPDEHAVALAADSELAHADGREELDPLLERGGHLRHRPGLAVALEVTRDGRVAVQPHEVAD